MYNKNVILLYTSIFRQITLHYKKKWHYYYNIILLLTYYIIGVKMLTKFIEFFLKNFFFIKNS